MIIVTLVATLAAAALWRQWRGVEVEAAERTRTQADWVLAGAFDWGRLLLRIDNNNNVDHLNESWAVPLAEARLSTFLAAGQPLEGDDRDAFLSGQITDLQSRLNLMNLTLDDDNKQSQFQVFGNLFKQLGLPTSDLEHIRDGLRTARLAMTATTQNSGAPLLPQRLEQLAWFGIAPQTIAALAPYATLLPDSGITTVNINTASAEVLAAAANLDLSSARRLVALREQNPFTSETLATLPSTGVKTEWLGVTSNFFEIRARLRLDDVAVEEVCVVRREGTTVIPQWRYRVPAGKTLP